MLFVIFRGVASFIRGLKAYADTGEGAAQRNCYGFGKHRVL